METTQLADLARNAAELFNAGKLLEAEQICRQVIEKDPEHARAMAILGIISFQHGKKTEGITLLESAVALQPDYAAAHANLGKILLEEGRFEEARRHCAKALELNSNLPLAHNDLGLIFWKTGKPDQAIAEFRQAVSLDPALSPAFINLAVVLRQRNKLTDSADSYRKAIAVNPGSAEAHNGLGIVLSDMGLLSEAEAAFNTAIHLKQDYFEPHVYLGNLFLYEGLITEAAAAYRQALSLKPGDAATHSNLVLALNYDSAVTNEQLFAEHLGWDRHHGVECGKAGVVETDKRSEGILRIGYVSADFRRHPVGHFLLPVIAAHDRKEFRIFCYNQNGKEDDITARFRRHADSWRDIWDMDDAAVEAAIRNDKIDILIDLSGHTSGNRLTVFARKPAPVQVTWAGYVGSTGLAAMDYLISDWRESPQGAEKFCTEKIIRLPDGYICFEPPQYAPPVGVLPAVRNGFVTFGCFNNLAKVTYEVVALWGKLLQHLPGSRMIMKTMALGDERVKRRFQEMFASAGVIPSRVDLLKGSPHRELLAAYNQVDIALDPFPYSGGLTTLEALWMGVPVVTLGGSRFCSRHSVSHLTNAGLPELVASGPDEYIRIAVALAKDIGRMETTRKLLRGKIAASPLIDGVRFTKNFENALRKAWSER